MAKLQVSETMLSALSILGGRHWLIAHRKGNYYRCGDGGRVRSFEALAARGLAEKEAGYSGWKITTAGETVLADHLASTRNK